MKKAESQATIYFLADQNILLAFPFRFHVMMDAGTYSYTLLSLSLSLLLPVVLTAQNCTFHANVGAESRHTPTADDADAHPLTLPLVIDRFP